MSVDPEVSSIDFSIGTVIVPGGTPVPGLNTRKSHTTVELRQGQTLAIAGLLQLTLEGQTTRVPGLGDFPIIGPFFSNTSSNRMEKELVVLVTPHLGRAEESRGRFPLRRAMRSRLRMTWSSISSIGSEGRTGRRLASDHKYDDPLRVLRCLMKLEDTYLCGPHGFGN
jgi:pilus assembly protein CpaC